jgi:hypothetical protein
MWVMLLWALTLPGQEVQVYSFLLQGTVAQESSDVIPADGSSAESTVKQEKGHVFPDAKASSQVVLNLQQLFHHPLIRLFFAAPVAEATPACAASPAGARLLLQMLPLIIQPNAP